MEQETEKQVSPLGLSLKDLKLDGIIIMSATGLAYLADYSFEIGYANYFGIPSWFITIDINTLLLFALVVIGFAFFIVNTYTTVFDSDQKPLRYEYYMQIHFFVLILLGFFVGYATNSVLYGVLAAPMLLMACASIDYMLYRIFVRRGVEKKEALDDIMNEGGMLGGIIKKKIAKYANKQNRLAVIILMVFALLAICQVLGYFNAGHTTTFAVLDSNNDQVILRHYGHSYVVAEFDAKANKILPKFRLIEDTNFDDVITMKNLGALSPVTAELR